MTTPIDNDDPISLPPLAPIPPCLSTPENIRSLAYNRDVSDTELIAVSNWIAATSNRVEIASNLFSLAVNAGNCRLVKTVWPYLDPEEAAKDAVHAIHTGAVRSDPDMIGTVLQLAPLTDLNDAARFAASFTHVGAMATLLRHARALPERQVERALVEAAIWYACRAVSVEMVTFLIREAGAECTQVHMAATIAGGSSRLRRNEVEVLACRIIETMLAHSEHCRADLITHGPSLLARCIEAGSQTHLSPPSRTRRARLRA
jgi:hypothetical protein